MKLSFIIPVYNSDMFIEKCLDSILLQDEKNINYEIVIINDGSTDQTDLIIKNMINKYPEIKYYKTRNNGLSSARNYGIKKSTGQYLIFVDSDDKISKNFFVNISNLLSNNTYDVIKFRIKCYEDEKYDKRFDTPTFKNLPGNDALLKFCESDKIFATPWSYIMNKNLVRKYSFSKNMHHEDYGIMPVIIFNAKNVTSVKFIGYEYIKRPNSLVTRNDDESEINRINDFITHTYNLIQYFNKQNIKQKDIVTIINYFIKRLNIKISHLNDNVKNKMNNDLISKIKENKI